MVIWILPDIHFVFHSLTPQCTLYTLSITTTPEKSIFTKNIIWKLQLVPLTHYVELYIQWRVGIKLNSRRTRLWIPWLSHWEGKSLTFEHRKKNKKTYVVCPRLSGKKTFKICQEIKFCKIKRSVLFGRSWIIW